MYYSPFNNLRKGVGDAALEKDAVYRGFLYPVVPDYFGDWSVFSFRARFSVHAAGLLMEAAVLIFIPYEIASRTKLGDSSLKPSVKMPKITQDIIKSLSGNTEYFLFRNGTISYGIQTK